MIFLAGGVTLASLGPALPQLAQHVRLDVAALGGLFTAISAGVVLAQFIVGRAGERYGLRVVLAGGMLLMGLGALGISLAGHAWLLFACALLGGFGFGNLITAGNVLVVALFPGRSAVALNAANVFFGVGAVLGPALVGLAGAQLAAPHAALWVGAAALLALAPVIFTAPQPHVQRAHSGVPQPVARPHEIRMRGLLMLLYTGTEVGLGGWVTLYMIAGNGLAPADAALVASGYWLALTVGRALGAAAGLRRSPQALLGISLGLALLGGVLLAAGVGRLGATLAGVLLLGLSFGPIFPTMLVLITRAAAGSARAMTTALVIGNCGGLVIPSALGLVLSRAGPQAMGAAVLGAVGLLAGLTLATELGAARTAAPAALSGAEAQQSSEPGSLL